jgi:predicted nucleic acid-binding protein
MNSLSGSEKFALDSSVLLFDYFAGGSEKVSQLLRESLLNEVTISETLYVICRIDGKEKASDYIGKCTKTVSAIAPSETISPLAGYLKCKFPISLADCWALATAKAFQVPCLFAFREAEIVKNFQSINEEVEIRFLDELHGPNRTA